MNVRALTDGLSNGFARVELTIIDEGEDMCVWVEKKQTPLDRGCLLLLLKLIEKKGQKAQRKGARQSAARTVVLNS